MEVGIFTAVCNLFLLSRYHIGYLECINQRLVFDTVPI